MIVDYLFLICFYLTVSPPLREALFFRQVEPERRAWGCHHPVPEHCLHEQLKLIDVHWKEHVPFFALPTSSYRKMASTQLKLFSPKYTLEYVQDTFVKSIRPARVDEFAK